MVDKFLPIQQQQQQIPVLYQSRVLAWSDFVASLPGTVCFCFCCSTGSSKSLPEPGSGIFCVLHPEAEEFCFYPLTRRTDYSLGPRGGRSPLSQCPRLLLHKRERSMEVLWVHSAVSLTLLPSFLLSCSPFFS